MITGVLAVQQRYHENKAPRRADQSVQTGVSQVLVVIMVVLVILAAVNAIFITLATAAVARRPLAVATSAQVAMATGTEMPYPGAGLEHDLNAGAWVDDDPAGSGARERPDRAASRLGRSPQGPRAVRRD